jgi:hypothetical protein
VRARLPALAIRLRRDKHAHLVIGHPKDLNSTTKIAHHATTQDIKNINKIIATKNVCVAKISKMTEIGHVLYYRL